MPFRNFYVEQLEEEYRVWKTIFEKGSDCNNIKDGFLLNLCRDRIRFCKLNIERELKDMHYLYPTSYFYPLPLRVKDDMICAEKISNKSKVWEKNHNLSYNDLVFFDDNKIFNLERFEGSYGV